jgi:hypothetical protein
MIDPSSMRLWLPHVERLGIPSPRTIVVVEPEPGFLNELFFVYEEHHDPPPGTERFIGDVVAAADAVGYPAFVRTDLCSAKQEWSDSCFVRSRAAVMPHTLALIEFGMNADMLGLPHTAIAARQYLALDAPFLAYRGLPIAAERRYFVRDGKVCCHHPYWEREAVAQGYPRCPEWEWHLARLNREDEDEIAMLSGFATAVGAALGGFWSIDFARDAAGLWWLIDMAVGGESWHPRGECPALKVCEVCGGVVDADDPARHAGCTAARGQPVGDADVERRE